MVFVQLHPNIILPFVSSLSSSCVHCQDLYYFYFRWYFCIIKLDAGWGWMLKTRHLIRLFCLLSGSTTVGHLKSVQERRVNVLLRCTMLAFNEAFISIYIYIYIYLSIYLTCTYHESCLICWNMSEVQLPRETQTVCFWFSIYWRWTGRLGMLWRYTSLTLYSD